MTITFTDLVQTEIDGLQRTIADLREKQEAAKQEIIRHEQTINRNEAKLEAMADVLKAAARADRSDTTKKKHAHADVEPGSNGSGGAKPKATEAIFALVDKQGSASKEEILALGDIIETTADNPRHILQTTLYLLVNKRGKLVKDGNQFKRAQIIQNPQGST